MGAISSASSIPVLQKYLNDPERTVRETCEIALAKIEWDNSEEGREHWSEASTSSDQLALLFRSTAMLYEILIHDFILELTHPSTQLPLPPACCQVKQHQKILQKSMSVVYGPYSWISRDRSLSVIARCLRCVTLAPPQLSMRSHPGSQMTVLCLSKLLLFHNSHSLTGPNTIVF